MIILILFGTLALLYLIFYLTKKKDLLYSLFVVEMCVAMTINFSVPFDGVNLVKIKKENEINEFLNKLNISENSLDRVYIGGFVDYFNFNRNTDVLVNENTFHSFINKYMYGHKQLYGGDQ